MPKQPLDLILRGDTRYIERRLARKFGIDVEDIPGGVRCMLEEVQVTVNVDPETWDYDIIEVMER